MDTTSRAVAGGKAAPPPESAGAGAPPPPTRRSRLILGTLAGACAVLGFLLVRQTAERNSCADDLTRRLDDARGALEVQIARGREAETTLSSRERALGDATAHLAARDKTIVDLQSALTAAGKTEESLRSDLGGKERALADVKALLGAAGGAESTLRADLSDRDASIADLRKRLLEAQDALAASVQEAEAKGRASADRSEALRRQADAEVREAKDRVARLESDLTTAQEERARLLKNNRLTLINDGERVFIEWALVVARDGSGDLTVREMSYREDDKGWYVDPGKSFDLGAGFVAVIFITKGTGSTPSLTEYLVSHPGDDGTFHLNHHWPQPVMVDTSGDDEE